MIGIDVDARQVLATMGGLIARSADLTPALEDVADDWLKVQNRNWRTRGGLVGGWRPLTAGTLENRRRNRQSGGGILEYRTARGGRMRAALTKKGAGWQIRDVGRDSVRVGTSLGIAAAHDKGFRGRLGATPVTIPKRPLMVPLSDLEARWAPIVANHLLDRDRGRGGLIP